MQLVLLLLGVLGRHAYLLVLVVNDFWRGPPDNME
jgi:hypothetical protein